MERAEKIYISLCLFFCTLIVIGNMTYQKFVTLPTGGLYTIQLSVGAILYPLTFLITDLIAEFYGKERASFCIKLSIFMNMVAAIIILLMDALPATTWSRVDNVTFHHVFGLYNVAFIASMLACYISQEADIFLYLWIKKITRGRYLWLRNNVSTAISLLMDTIIVVEAITLFNIVSKEYMWTLIWDSYRWKLFFTLCSTPLFYLCASVIRLSLTTEPSGNPRK